MNIGDYGPLGQVVYDSGLVKTELTTLTDQVASGYISNNYGGLGSGASTAVSLQPEITSLSTQQSAIDVVNGRMSLSQTALTQINSIASTFNSQIATLTNVSPTMIDNVAVQARSALQQVAGLLDTSDAGSYIFAGTDSSNPPIPNPGSILTSSFYTQIQTAVQGLGTNGAAATTTSILNATSTASPFSTALSNTATPSSSLISTVQLGSSGPTQVGVLANRNTLVVASTGANSTGSYMQDIVMSLATLSNLSSSQANTPGFTTLVQTTQSNLSNAITSLGIESGALGNTQTSLTSQQSQMTDTSNALQQQVSSVEDVDMAKTISEVSQVQTQLTASYKLISQMQSLSLANYLPT